MRSFLSQTWERKELILVSEDEIDFPAHPDVRLVKCEPGLTVGAKRNIGAAAARGEVIAHFDSDDASAPGRIEEQLRLMRQCEKPVVGYNSILFLNASRNEAYKLRPGPSSWAAGTSLMYTRQYWQANNFEDRSVGEDTAFAAAAARQGAIFGVDGGDRIVALDHDANTSPRSGDGETHEYSPWYYHPIEDVESVRRLIFPAKKKVALSLLSWNLKEIVLENIEALKAEAKRLQIVGYDTEIIVADNGSTDGTQAELKKLKGELTLVLNKRNLGSSVARNQVIDKTIKGDADYLLFMDGDITLVPWSVVSMVSCMEASPAVPCLGAFWEQWADDPAKCSPCWTRRIEPMRCDIIAPTQYGVWRRDLFEAVRFDEGFGPGWGFEDDDLFLQMKEKAFQPFIFAGMTYLHRHIHHGHHGHANGNALYEERRQYMIDKWKDRSIATSYMKYFVECQPPNIAD